MVTGAVVDRGSSFGGVANSTQIGRQAGIDSRDPGASFTIVQASRLKSDLISRRRSGNILTSETMWDIYADVYVNKKQWTRAPQVFKEERFKTKRRNDDDGWTMVEILSTLFCMEFSTLAPGRLVTRSGVPMGDKLVRTQLAALD